MIWGFFEGWNLGGMECGEDGKTLNYGEIFRNVKKITMFEMDRKNLFVKYLTEPSNNFANYIFVESLKL